MNRTIAVLLVLLPATSLALTAQDASDSAAYRALTQTTIGAFGHADARSTGGVAPGRLAISARYGIRSLDDREYTHNFGASVSLPVGSATLGLVAGYSWPDCRDAECDGHVMVGASWSERLAGIALGGGDASALLNIGIDLSAGYGDAPDGASLWAAAFQVPVTLAPRRTGLRFFPYVSPGVGAGLVRDDGTEAGLRAMFETGVVMVTPGDRFGISAGLQRVFLTGGNWLAGLSATWRWPPR